MALANFFDKAALAASQILKDFDRSSFEQLLEDTPVLLAFDESVVESPEGLATLDMSARLLGRLYPRICVRALDAEARNHCPTVVGLLQSINPDVELEREDTCPAAALVIGKTPISSLQPSAPVFYVGSDEWLVRLSPTAPVGSGNSSNPFAAGAAACLGAANVFRAVFKDMLPNPAADGEVSLSLLDYSLNAAPQNNAPSLPEDIQLSETILVGAGAIGNGALWALQRVKGARGKLHFVDHDPVSLSNLQRYVLTVQENVGALKVNLAAELFRDTSVEPVPHPDTWASFMGKRQDWKLPRVAVAVDTATARVAIQASMPLKVINAWTQASDLGVSRHYDFLEDACLACLYFPKGQQKSESELVAEALGLPEPTVREMLYRHTVVDREVAEIVATTMQQPVERLLPFIGKPLRIFYQETVCGGVLLATGDGQMAETPMAFQSALAGIMLAAELVLDDMGLQGLKTTTTTRINLLEPLGRHLNIPVKKHAGGRCICSDKHFQKAFREKYSL